MKQLFFLIHYDMIQVHLLKLFVKEGINVDVPKEPIDVFFLHNFIIYIVL